MNRINTDIIEKRLFELNKTRNDLAAYVDVDYQTVYKWEKGKMFPRRENLERICEFLKIDRKELIISGNSEQTYRLIISRYYSENQELLNEKDHAIIKAIAQTISEH